MKVTIGRQLIDKGEHVRVYHSRVLLSEKQLPLVEGSLMEVAARAHAIRQEQVLEANAKMLQSGNTLEKLMGDPVGVHPIVESVIGLTGVEYAFGASYQLVVFKGRSFDWSELEPTILRLMTTFSLPLDNVTNEKGGEDATGD